MKKIKKNIKRRELFGVQDVADLCGVSRVTIWRWIKSGKLTAHDVAGRTIITSEDLFELLMRYGAGESAVVGRPAAYSDRGVRRDITAAIKIRHYALQKRMDKYSERWDLIENNPRLVAETIKSLTNWGNAIGDLILSFEEGIKGNSPSPEAKRFMQHHIKETMRREAALLVLLDEI